MSIESSFTRWFNRFNAFARLSCCRLKPLHAYRRASIPWYAIPGGSAYLWILALGIQALGRCRVHPTVPGFRRADSLQRKNPDPHNNHHNRRIKPTPSKSHFWNSFFFLSFFSSSSAMMINPYHNHFSSGSNRKMRDI